jgi:hypothetical protein
MQDVGRHFDDQLNSPRKATSSFIVVAPKANISLEKRISLSDEGLEPAEIETRPQLP